MANIREELVVKSASTNVVIQRKNAPLKIKKRCFFSLINKKKDGFSHFFSPTSKFFIVFLANTLCFFSSSVKFIARVI